MAWVRACNRCSTDGLARRGESFTPPALAPPSSSSGKEPASLTQYRLTPSATYDDYREKDELRQSLLREQGHLCCHCMQRISLERMRIEHWAPQEDDKELQLAYKNLLGACQGGERTSEERREEQLRPKEYRYKSAPVAAEPKPAHAYHHCDVCKHHTRSRFIHLALDGPAARSFIVSRASGTSGSMPKINQSALLSIPMPLPPSSKQRQPAAKVGQLMKLCDHLEASLRLSEDRASKLADAVVRDLVA